MELGKKEQEFIVRSTIKLKQWNVLAYDIVFGQQLVVTSELGDNQYGVKLMTHDVNEGIKKKYFNGTTEWIVLINNIMREFNSSAPIEEAEGQEKFYLTLV